MAAEAAEDRDPRAPRGCHSFGQKHGGDPDVPDLATLRERFQFTDFPHFIRTWMWKTGFLRDYDDFARENIMYAEAFVTPLDYESHGLEPGRLVQALRAGLSRVPGVEVRLLEQLAEVGTAEVLGIGLGGSEQTFPAEPFAAVFERARELGFRTTAPAASGPRSRSCAPSGSVTARAPSKIPRWLTSWPVGRCRWSAARSRTSAPR